MTNIYQEFAPRPEGTPAAQPSTNIYDEFRRPTPTDAPQSSPIPSTTPSAPPVSGVPTLPAPPPAPVNEYERFVKPDPPVKQEVGPMDSPIQDREPPVDPARPWAFTQGFWSTLLNQNPELFADFLESGARIAGDPNVDPIAGVLQGASQDIRSHIPNIGSYKMSGKQFTDIKSFDDAMTWMGESAGQALGSSAATILPAIAGSAVGSRVAGKTGAFVGGGMGLFSGSFAMSQGEVYSEMKKAGVPEREGAIASLPAAAFMAALDSALPGMLIAKVAGAQEIKREVARGIARRVATEAAKGAGVESLTEAAQEAISNYAVLFKTNKEWTTENWKNVVNAAAAGFVGGATLSGATGVAPDKTTTKVQDDTLIEAGGSPNAPAAPEVKDRVEPYFDHTDFGGRGRTGATPAPAPSVSEVPPPAATTEPQPAAPPVATAPVEDIVNPVQGNTELGQSDIWYSPMRKFVEESKQTIATADQWLKSMQNTGAVRNEELRDTGIQEWLEAQANRGEKVTKGDLLREIEERAITVEERILTGDSRVDPNTYMPRGDSTQYGDYVLPGEHNGYTELMLYHPGDPEQMPYIAPHFGRVEGAPRGAGNANLLAHARISEREDRDGNPVATIEEIQSDWHQKGRKEGYAQVEPLKWNPRKDSAQPGRIFYAYDQSGREITISERNDGWVFRSNRHSPQLYGSIDDAYAAAARHNLTISDKVPDAPFKSSWDELTFKRILRWAADKGYRRIAIANGAEQLRRYPQLTAEQQQGQNKFYDNDMPKLMKKWAKRLGGRVVETRFEQDMGYDNLRTIQRNPNSNGVPYVVVNETIGMNEAYFFTESEARDYLEQQRLNNKWTSPAPAYFTIELPESGLGQIQEGLPQYARGSVDPIVPGQDNFQVQAANTGHADFVAIAQQLAPALEKLAKAFKIDGKIKLFIHDGDIKWTKSNGKVVTDKTSLGLHVGTGHGKVGPRVSHQIHVAANKIKSAEYIWTVMVHELGHALQYEYLDTAPAEVKASIRAAYNEYLAKVNPKSNPLLRRVLGMRLNPVMWLEIQPVQGNLNDVQSKQYWYSFEEWFAEQVARWAVTSTKPLSTVEQFFSGLSKTLMKYWATAMDMFGLSFTPAKAVADYLDAAMTNAPWTQEMYKAHDFLTEQDNQKYMGEGEIGVPMQPETTAIRDRLDQLFNGRRFWPWKVRQAAAYADKFNFMYKLFWGLHQVAQRNLHIKALQLYTEVISVAQLTKQQIMSRPHEVIKMWNKLGVARSDKLAAFIDDINNMVYLTPDEVNQKVARKPTDPEVNALVRKHGLDNETLQVYNGIKGTFEDFIERFRAVLLKEANKITDPAQKQARIESVQLQIAALLNKPYFPAMRFGNYTLTIRNAAGKVIHFETFERKRTRDNAASEIMSKYGVKKDAVQLGYMDEQAAPLMGMPTQLLEMMASKLTLTQKQRDALEQMKFELSPAQSFKHRFQHKRRIAGYSMDFRRVYANYFLHGGNHIMKVMYADDLRALRQAVRTEVKGFDVTKRHEISNYLSDHLQNWLDPKSDWMALRSLTFLWHLAWSPAAAGQNLMQTIMTTQPFLAHKFGDGKATGTIMRVMGDLTSFYKRGKLENLTGIEYQAITKAIQEGVISEAMAPEMAALAEGNNLRGIAGDQFEQAFIWFNEKGAFLFEMAEQFNRRVVFRSAFKLAKANPGAKYVRDMVTKHQLKYQELRNQNWTEEDAAAYVTALDSTHETQFRYGREFAPRFMRGKARAIFVFKTFITSYIIFLRQYPAAGLRSLLFMGFLGGLMAQPGADDLKEIVKMLGWQFFGKDWDVEKELRKYIVHLMGEDENGRQIADFALHGAAKRGFGIPAAFDMLGGTVGVDVPMPTLDRSRSISAGTLLPVELGQLFGPPTQDPGQAFLRQSQKAAGASLSPAFEIFKSIRNERLPWTDSKRWEHAVPRAMGSAARMYRYWSEGRERTQTGATVVRFDVRDPEQLAEVLAVGAGYQPLRLSGAWDKIIAKREEAKLWDIRRQMIMRQVGNALDGKDQKDIDLSIQAVRDFNKSVEGTDARGMAISSDALKKSYSMRKRQQDAAEKGTTMKKSHIPIYEAIDKLYPDYENVVKPVPGAYRPRF